MFYIALFNKELDILEHRIGVIQSLFFLILGYTDAFMDYTYERCANLADEWEYHNVIECMRRYNIPINKLADKTVDGISICNDFKSLQKTMLKNIKSYMSKYDKSSEEYANMKKFYERTEISDNPESLVEILNLMKNLNLMYNKSDEDDDTTNYKLFYDFDEYLEYIFDK